MRSEEAWEGASSPRWQRESLRSSREGEEREGGGSRSILHTRLHGGRWRVCLPNILSAADGHLLREEPVRRSSGPASRRSERLVSCCFPASGEARLPSCPSGGVRVARAGACCCLLRRTVAVTAACDNSNRTIYSPSHGLFPSCNSPACCRRNKVRSVRVCDRKRQNKKGKQTESATAACC